jgi:hypothetical protein
VFGAAATDFVYFEGESAMTHTDNRLTRSKNIPDQEVPFGRED